MPSKKPKMAAGLDVGRNATHFVVVERSGAGDLKVRHAARFDYKTEGILSEDEVATPLQEWLSASGFGNVPCVIGVPQHSSILQLSDFPPGDEKQLDEMVAYETKQLGGLSDEDFLHDYGRVAPFHVYNNPALIAICRESLVDQRLEQGQGLGVHISDVTCDGAALALAVQRLRRRQVRLPRTLDVIVDVGAEASTALLLIEDKVVFAASMPVGADRFPQGQALDPEGDPSHLAAADALVREIRQAVEHWRYQREENDFTVNRLLLVGEGATVTGLDVLLEQRFEKPVERLQLPDDSSAHSPALLTAWGLALTQLLSEETPYALSLAPPALRRYQHRLSQTQFLGAALLLAATAAVLLLVVSIIDLNRDVRKLTAINNSLQECADLGPQVEAVRSESKNIEEMLIPFVAYGRRNRAFIGAMQSIGPHQQSEDWLAYLADEPSYGAPLVDYKATNAATVTGPAASPFSLLGDPRGNAKANAGPPPVVTTAIMPSRFYIAAGFTPRFTDEPLRNVRKTVDSINSSNDSPFGEASVLPTVDAQVRVSIRPWVDTFQMKAFFLMLPSAETPYDPDDLQ